MVYNICMSVILISENANIRLKDYLTKKGHLLCEAAKASSVYGAISSHPDIYVCQLCDELAVARDLFPFFEKLLSEWGTKYILGSSFLGYEYPENIKYNAVQLRELFVHNTKYTDSGLLSSAKAKGLNIVHVNQGYTKCNIVKVDENSVITSDAGIAHSLIPYGIDTLIVSQGHVKLKGFQYGFLGGSSGRVDDEIIFNGDLSAHPDYLVIRNFIENRGLKTVFFKEYPLDDIGSIIQI